MRLFINLLLVLILITLTLRAQLSTPSVEAVYGGRINAITGFAKNSDTTRIFISTESANSIFFTDIFANSSSPEFLDFQVMPGVNAASGYGPSIQFLAAHEASGNVLFGHETGLLSSNPNSTAVSIIDSSSIDGLLIKDDFLFYTKSGNLHFGTLDGLGTFAEDSSSPVSVPTLGGYNTLFVNPVNDTLYIFSEGFPYQITRLTDTYDNINSSTSSVDITPSVIPTGIIWNAFGIAPDGTIYIIGSDGLDKYVMYSSDEINWSDYSMNINGVTGRTVAFSGSARNYRIFNSSVYNSNSGSPTDWFEFGNPGGMETHPNDGAIFVDPINDEIVYMTTDQGIGASIDGGETIFEIGDGVEAVQVNDLDMSSDKNSAWIASKSGIRKVINYQTSPVWTNSIFPMNDGSPYFSVDMNPNDTNDVFVGNVRIYKTEDNGSTWNMVFSPEDSPYNFSNIGTRALAIEVSPYNTETVMAGFEVWDSEKGGLFISYNSGASWEQILLEATSSGADIDVTDIVFNIEGTDTVAYVSALYDLSAPQGRSVYKLTKTGSSWSVQQDMDAATTSTGSLIVASIWDLEVSNSGDTIFAAGTDAGINHPIAYYKPLNTTGLWTPLTTSGFPFSVGKQATAVSIGVDTLFCAVDNEIYYHVLGSSSWSLGYSYPVGTRINVLYYDELLAGTDLGLFAFFGSGGAISIIESAKLPTNFNLLQNYPNPFNPTTIIEFIIPSNEYISLKVYDILGNEIATLVNEAKQAGRYKVSFNASNLSSGVYLYKLHFRNKAISRKMLLIK